MPPASSLFSQGVAQFLLGGLHLTIGLIAKQNCPQFVTLIIMGDEFSLGVGATEVHPGRLHTKVTDEMQPDVEHFRPEIRDLLVTNPFLASHVCACDQALRAGIVPM